MPAKIHIFECKDSDSIQITANCSTDMVSPTPHHSGICKLYVFSVHLIKNTFECFGAASSEQITDNYDKYLHLTDDTFTTKQNQRWELCHTELTDRNLPKAIND